MEYNIKTIGVLTSGGIFPDIVEPLRVQKDYYLGFRTETPDGGLPAYGGKGHYTKKLKLDHSGLRGSGELTYLASRAKSKDFLFLPDSTVALTDTSWVDAPTCTGCPIRTPWPWPRWRKVTP